MQAQRASCYPERVGFAPTRLYVKRHPQVRKCLSSFAKSQSDKAAIGAEGGMKRSPVWLLLDRAVALNSCPSFFPKPGTVAWA